MNINYLLTNIQTPEPKYLENSLKQLRNTKGLNQEKVANMLGLKYPDRISHWEKCSAVPGIINLFKLCIIYNILPHELYPKLWNALQHDLTEKYTESISYYHAL